jgi:hypothetical protein
MNNDNVAKLLTDEQAMERLEQINKLESYEEQGYQSAPMLIQIIGCTPHELAFQTLQTTRPDDCEANLLRTLGLIRWCFDNRR